MSHSLKITGLILGCIIGFALTARLAFALPMSLFGPIGGLADVANELSIVIALLAAGRLNGQLRNYIDNRARRRVLEEGFVKWLAELETRRLARTSLPEPPLKKVA